MRPSLDSFAKPRPSLDAFVEQNDPNYFERVGSAYQGSAERIISAADQFASSPDLLAGSGTPVLEAAGITARKTGALLRTGLRTVGGAAAEAFTPILQAPGIRQVTEAVVDRAMQFPIVQDITKRASDLAQKNPELASDLFDIVNIATIGGGGAAEKPVLNEARAIGQDIAAGARALLTPSESAVQSKVIELFKKSIKPTAKKTAQQADQYSFDTLNALKTIKANSASLNIEDAAGELIEGRTPQTIQELAQAVEQTKKTVFTQYDTLAKMAGSAGVEIDVAPIAKELDTVINNKALSVRRPEVIKHATELKKRLVEINNELAPDGKTIIEKPAFLNTETIQEIIEGYNSDLKAFYRNPTYESASKAAVDAGVANNLRKALDEAIEGATGEQYQALRNQYAALKAIENDVVRAAMREGRKNAKGLLDYTDIFTGGQMLAGIMSLNPAMFTKGAIERGFKEWIKWMNDPNRAVKNIFDKLDVQPGSFEPVSATGKALKYPSLGMSIRDINRYDDSGRLIPNGDKAKNAAKNGAWPTTPSKKSTDGVTSTGNGATERGGVSARKADTSAPFDYVYHNTNPKNLESIARDGLKTGAYGDISFAPTEAAAQGYGGSSAARLRVKREKIGEYREGVAAGQKQSEIAAKKPIAPEDLEVFKDGKWQPLKPSPSIPKELEPLAKEARKYKSAEEFERAVADFDDIFTDEYNGLFSVKAAEVYAKNKKLKPESFSERDFDNTANWIDEEYAQTTDTSKPGLAVEYNGQILLIDGWHRATKAWSEGNDFRAYVVPEGEASLKELWEKLTASSGGNPRKAK